MFLLCPCVVPEFLAFGLARWDPDAWSFVRLLHVFTRRTRSHESDVLSSLDHDDREDDDVWMRWCGLAKVRICSVVMKPSIVAMENKTTLNLNRTQ